MKGTLKILSLEDLEDDFYLITRALKKSGLDFVARRVDSKEEFSNAEPDRVIALQSQSNLKVGTFDIFL